MTMTMTMTIKSLISLTTLFNITTIERKSLTALSTLFYFTTIAMKSLVSHCNHYTVLLHVKIKSLAVVTTLFYFTSMKMNSMNMLSTLFFSHCYKNEICDYTYNPVLLYYY